MGLFGSTPTSLKFDVAEIKKMRKKIQDTANDLKNFKTTLLNELDTLKKQWDTPAGKKFTSDVDTDWGTQVEQYIKIMNAVDELLEVAETNYTTVEEDAKKISF